MAVELGNYGTLLLTRDGRDSSNAYAHESPLCTKIQGMPAVDPVTDLGWARMYLEIHGKLMGQSSLRILWLGWVLVVSTSRPSAAAQKVPRGCSSAGRFSFICTLNLPHAFRTAGRCRESHFASRLQIAGSLAVISRSNSMFCLIFVNPAMLPVLSYLRGISRCLEHPGTWLRRTIIRSKYLLQQPKSDCSYFSIRPDSMFVSFF